MHKLVLILSFCLPANIAFPQDVQYYYNAAKKAFENKDRQEFYSNIMKAYELHPYNQNILWHAGLAAVLNNKPEESITFLVRAININTGYDLDDPNLVSLKGNEAFRQLKSTKKTLETPVIQSDTAFVVFDRQIHLESVAYDPIGDALYGGSIHRRKIIRIGSDGTVSDFATSGQSKMGAVFGVKVDHSKRMLWACTSAVPEMQQYDSALISTLCQFDIVSGKLLNSFQPADTLTGHIFGDLVLNSKGEPFVSDSRNNIIYRYDPLGKLLPYFSSEEFWNIQGLAFSDDDRFLYISDYIKGIYLLDMQSGKLTKVAVSYDLSLKGTDGITFFKNSLITLQNGVWPNRVVRHFLNETGTEFIRYEYVDNAHPAFGEPTIGSLWKNTFYYVANSQWSGYENGKIKNAADLQPVVILKHTFHKIK